MMASSDAFIQDEDDEEKQIPPLLQDFLVILLLPFKKMTMITMHGGADKLFG